MKNQFNVPFIWTTPMAFIIFSSAIFPLIKKNLEDISFERVWNDAVIF